MAGLSALVVLGAVVGAAVPLVRDTQAARITLLAFAAGVMLGAAFFHMLPEAFETGGPAALGFTPVGFVVMFLLERYVFVHVCEEPPGCAEHVHPGGTLGLAAFFGLAVHTLFDGVALGSSAAEGVATTTFLAILAHKVPSSLSLAAILKSEGKGNAAILGWAAVFGAMVPLGAGLFFALESAVHFTRFAPYALGFSSGTFLYISVSDLLPHVNRHGRDKRVGNVLALLLGLGLMAVASHFLREGH